MDSEESDSEGQTYKHIQQIIKNKNVKYKKSNKIQNNNLKRTPHCYNTRAYKIYRKNKTIKSIKPNIELNLLNKKIQVLLAII